MQGCLHHSKKYILLQSYKIRQQNIRKGIYYGNEKNIPTVSEKA